MHCRSTSDRWHISPRRVDESFEDSGLAQLPQIVRVAIKSKDGPESIAVLPISPHARHVREEDFLAQAVDRLDQAFIERQHNVADSDLAKRSRSFEAINDTGKHPGIGAG